MLSRYSISVYTVFERSRNPDDTDDTALTLICRFAAYPCVILQDKRRDVDLLGSDAGEELLQVVQVANLVFHPRHTEGGEEPR